jgi:DNA-binding PadR family transcriptional regulator
MSENSNVNLLARLAGAEAGGDGANPWSEVAATVPEHEKTDSPDQKIDAILARIKEITTNPTPPPSTSYSASAAKAKPIPVQINPALAEAEAAENQDTFLPREPETFSKAGLNDSEVEALILKFLLARGDSSGHEIADQVKLSFVPVDSLLREMKNQQMVCHRGAAPMNDFQYQLTDLGRERARRYSEHCTYFGSAPVTLEDYIQGVKAQSLTNQHPTADDLHRAFEDLVLNKKMLDRLGPAINSGRGLFLFGPPGNGKTSIAERVTAAFGQTIWIPRSIGVDGEIIRLFDPVNHKEMPRQTQAGLIDNCKVDNRWIRIRRPTIIAGGELTMEQLEVTVNRGTGICEAPLQMKSNCGTLVIDDFGRQRMRIDELLNRWIVPLEKRYDYLGLPNGKKLDVPFDQLIIFSTNLEPRDLVDEAFLRRIPYKIEVIDPTEDDFYTLFEIMAKQLGMIYRKDAVDYLLDSFYKKSGRPMRFCQPRDLLLQVKNYCLYYKQEPELKPEFLDFAVENYFAVM